MNLPQSPTLRQEISLQILLDCLFKPESGLFGISIDAQTKTITVNPHLPASWDHAAIMNLQIPGGPTSLFFDRKGDHLEVLLGSTQGEEWHIRSDRSGTTFGPTSNALEGLRIPLPALEIDHTLSSLPNVIDEVRSAAPDRPPLPGARTARLHILRSDYAGRKLTLTAEGRGGSECIVALVRHGKFIPRIESQSPSVQDAGSGEAKISMRERSENPAVPALLVFDFPPGEGWKTITVTLTW